MIWPWEVRVKCSTYSLPFLPASSSMSSTSYLTKSRTTLRNMNVGTAHTQPIDCYEMLSEILRSSYQHLLKRLLSYVHTLVKCRKQWYSVAGVA